jgi:hypothetical protein
MRSSSRSKSRTVVISSGIIGIAELYGEAMAE